MDMGLKGKVAVVTGGSRGIGLYTARALGAEGARLALCARNADGLESAAESLRAEGVVDVLTVVCDIAAGGRGLAADRGDARPLRAPGRAREQRRRQPARDLRGDER